MKSYKNLFFIILFFYSLLQCSSENNSSDEKVFHTPESLESYLEQVYQDYPAISYLETVGESVDGRAIHALSISDNPTEFEGEPKIRLTGSIHGDENATTEVLVRLIEYLVSGYTDSDPDIVDLINSRYIVIIPMMNPDGVVYRTRYNANYVDLNRNFDDHWEEYLYHGSAPFSEPESLAVSEYSKDMVFHSSLTFHTGAAVVNMPFDYASANRISPFEDPVESDLVQYLALQYTESGSFLETPGLMSNDYTYNGTINGGDWYIINGSMQDWSYLQSGCIDFTVEITTSDPDTSAGLDKLFDLNRDSMISFIEASGMGVSGRVTDSDSNPVAGVSISVYDIDNGATGDIITSTDDFGYYHRILLQGSYNLTFSADGFNDYTENSVNVVSGTLTDLNIQMTTP